MSRGRGRPPGILLDEAGAIARRRGGVIRIPGGRSDDFDLIIIEEFRNVFVRCRSSATNLCHMTEILRRYDRDIARMSRMPRSKNAVCEFWLRQPRGKWLFCLVTHAGIEEIPADGTLVYRPVQPVLAGDSPAGTVECPRGKMGFTSEEGE
jgi:hypothetical protein